MNAAPTRRQRLGGSLPLTGLLLSAMLVGAFAAGRSSAALFVDSGSSSSNSFATAFWGDPPAGIFYFHNRPTPPTGNTTAQVNLGADNLAPTATGTYRYSTDVGSGDWRVVQRQGTSGCGAGVNESAAKCYVNWRSGNLYGPINTSANVHLWVALISNGGDRQFTVYARKLNTVSGTYTDLDSAQVALVNGATPLEYVVPLNLATTFASNEVLEIKVIDASTNRDIRVAYDTTAYPSRIDLGALPPPTPAP